MRILLLSIIFSLSACAVKNEVMPWEKGNLSKTEMIFDNDPLEAGFKEHIYSSKESSSGGMAVGGGGCGCN
jgi:hypothetical protein